MNPGQASWEAKGVKVGAIEAQLQRLWSAADGAWEGEGRRPDIRTSVLNCVVYARDDATAELVLGQIDQLAGSHPSRTIVLLPGRSHGEASIDANVAIKTRGAYAEYRQVSSEVLRLKLHGPAATHVDSVVLPLLAPDLPVFVWWPGETPFRHHAFVQLRDAANRFIVDSEDFEHPEGELVEMARTVQHALQHCAFSDFNWLRLAPWRAAIAELFDPPEFLPCLQSLSTVFIQCDGGSASLTKAQGLLLAGWLAGRLSMRVLERSIEPRRHSYVIGNERQRTSVEVRFDRDTAELSGAPLVRLQCDSADFTLSHDGAIQTLTAAAETNLGTGTSRRVHLPSGDRVQLLYQELEIFGHDPIYEEALHHTAAFLDPGYQRVKASIID
ncbi:MAG: glucose-6-phosphate dehydrogenase assembly protein OpcA [Chloroflexota bacterium]|nr:glucose-6-phosphate dehydrogenase assembly protein OpcA [Chloroflexota bacterium]